MSLTELSVIVANAVIVLTGLGAAAAWTWAVWQWYHTVRQTSSQINGQLAEIARLLHLIQQDQVLMVRPSLRGEHPPASVLGPLDVGPPH